MTQEKIKLSEYQVACHTFTQIIITNSLKNAVEEFERLYPNEEIICATNNEVMDDILNKFNKESRP